MDNSSSSSSKLRVRKMLSGIPSSIHLRKRLYKTTVQGLPRAVTLRQVSSGRIAAGKPNHSVQNGAVILSGTSLFTRVFRWQQRRDAVPFFVGRLISSQRNGTLLCLYFIMMKVIAPSSIFQTQSNVWLSNSF